MNRWDLNEPSWLVENTPSALAQSMLYYVQSAGHYYYKRIAMVNKKNYDSILVAYTLCGNGLLKYRDVEYSIKKGDLFIIDCLEHQYYAPNACELWEIVYIHFNGSESRKLAQYILSNNGPLFTLYRQMSLYSLEIS